MKANYDIVVIGFGKAGKTLAAKFSKSGKSVALVEKDKNMYGGTCINVGCIPSKRLITDASKSQNMEFEEKVQYYRESVVEKKKLIAALNKANYDKIASAGVEIIDGTASFKDNHHIVVSTKDGNVEIEAEKFIINTGSVTVIPKIEGADSKGVYTSESIMNLEELPKRLTIVGGGYIGLEFASMYADFGSKVTIVQDGDVFLPREDDDIAKAIREVLEAKGVEIVTGAKVTKAEEGKLYYEIAGEAKTLDSDAILLAVGRRPNTDDLGCENAGVKLTDRGAVVTDEHLKTTADNIWAAGDVCGKLQFTYISLDDSRIIWDEIMGEDKRTTENRGAFSYSVFINPPFSRVGMSEKDAKAAGLDYRVLSLSANAIPKAKVLRKTEGLLKALVTSDGTILGAELFCEESYEMINFIKLAMDNGIKAKDIANFIFTHPTMSESLNDLFAI
ncbi:FAD-dependent oxidoreductase [Lachnoanaerobaculum umeaense]|uniref:Pyridine nucleotide-disulfide oxidoreductase n=1 Tax=Lachnoanaerobaculum umeaense TaxID=617123 RepID=A0A385PZM8_9FIRM|nr:FAD-dependent oxidoreductase [Lachnoanaerobaculum umeaense]AYA99631.1 pyridine nucleotide-disulfide oxidoreductase [Lachnoanaerobaculum umeaense]PZW98649.1 pyruvate/2-oxoglutarate dehydrogenase complex dihydrolipoamide dehydrogenase (E3) component [Lachnoanaerobaculum umeaense]